MVYQQVSKGTAIHSFLQGQRSYSTDLLTKLVGPVVPNGTPAFAIPHSQAKLQASSSVKCETAARREDIQHVAIALVCAATTPMGIRHLQLLPEGI